MSSQPVTRRFLSAATKFRYCSPLEVFWRLSGKKPPKSSFIEYWVVSELGLLTIVAFLGWRPLHSVLHGTHQWSLMGYLLLTIWLICVVYTVWTVIGVCSSQASIHLLDPEISIGLHSSIRTVILAFLNVFEIIIAFGALYQLFFCLYGGSPLRLAEGTKHLFPLDALYFSSVTLTTIGYGDITPVARTYRLATTAESMIGLFLVVIVLARTIGYLQTRGQTKPSGGEDEEKELQSKYLAGLRQEEQTDPKWRRRICGAVLVLAVVAIVLEVFWLEPSIDEVFPQLFRRLYY